MSSHPSSRTLPSSFVTMTTLRALLLVTIFCSLQMAAQVDANCTPCRSYFDNLRNQSQGGCRCIYYDVYSRDHPHVIADCNNLQQVPNFNAICNMSDVYQVNLGTNNIEQVNRFAFKALEVSDAVLEWAGGIPELILMGNKINYIHPEAFKGGMESKLALLDLRDNQLDAIPAAIFKLVNLTKLYLKDNQIESAHGEAKLKKLTVLDLTSNKLKSFPGDVCQFPKLKYLYLDGNPIEKDLSESLDALGNCPHLLELTWPKPTAICEKVAIETYSNSTTCKIIKVRHGNNRMVMCDPKLSSPEYRGSEFEWAIRRGLSKVCSEISGSNNIHQNLFNMWKTLMVVTSVLFMVIVW